MSLVLENPLQPVLEIPSDLTLWAETSSNLDAAAQWQLYLHQLAASTLVQWCQDATENSQSGNRPTVQLWPSANPLDIWHVVDGLAITLGKRRIVVTLSEAMDASEMRVPQEWLDLPAWAGDYYIAAYIDVDEQQLALWGYTTHSQLKHQGQYDAGDRTYCISEDSLIQDFSAFWAAQTLESLDTVTLEAIPAVSQTQLDNLISRLAGSLEPRLEIPFSLWGALLSNPDARSRLYQQRQGKAMLQTTLASAPTQLGQWTTQLLSQGWDSLARLLPQAPALSIRSNTTGSDPTSTTAATATTGAKEIVLETATETVVLVLAIAVTIEEDERRNIRIRLYPTQASADNESVLAETPLAQSLSIDLPTDEPPPEEALLPAGVTLTLLLTETQQQLQTVCSGDRDNYIQLSPFRCPADQAFSVRIQYADGVMQEDFVS